MRITLVGSRHFGVTTFEMLRQHGVDIARVVVADADDRLAAAARAAGIEVTVQANPKLVVATEIADGTDLIVTAHSHARISREALAAARLGGIGYHPSLLPRHRGIAAVEWTIRERDPIAGGTVYHLADRMDAGAIAAQEWCFVRKGETARELWERALAPLGQKLLGEVIDYAKIHKSLPCQAAGRAVCDRCAEAFGIESSGGRYFETAPPSLRHGFSFPTGNQFFPTRLNSQGTICGYCGAANFEHISPEYAASSHKSGIRFHAPQSHSCCFASFHFRCRRDRCRGSRDGADAV